MVRVHLDHKQLCRWQLSMRFELQRRQLLSLPTRFIVKLIEPENEQGIKEIYK